MIDGWKVRKEGRIKGGEKVGGEVVNEGRMEKRRKGRERRGW